MSKAAKEIYNVHLRLVTLNNKSTLADAQALRRAAIALHRWYEHECNGIIQRDEETDIPYWYNSLSGNCIGKAPDREKGAIKTIAKICQRLGLHYYLQTDPRGGTLYVDKAPISKTAYNRATFVA